MIVLQAYRILLWQGRFESEVYLPASVISYTQFFVHILTYSEAFRTTVRYDELAGSILNQAILCVHSAAREFFCRIVPCEARCLNPRLLRVYWRQNQSSPHCTIPITFAQKFYWLQAVVNNIQRYSKIFGSDNSGLYTADAIYSGMAYSFVYLVR